MKTSRPPVFLFLTLGLLLALGSGCGDRESGRSAPPSGGVAREVKEALAKVRIGAGKAGEAIDQTAETVKEIVADARRSENEAYARWRHQKARTGTLPESLENEEAFYGVRGGFDYDRAPLAWPLHLVRLGTKGSIDLCRGTAIVVPDVRQIGKSGEWLFGTTASDAFAHSVSGGETVHFPSRDALDAFLAESGIANPSLYPCDELLKEYMYYGILPFPPWGRGTRTQLAVIFDPDAPDDAP